MVWAFSKRSQNSPTTDADLDLMANPEWSDWSAAWLIDCLVNQMEPQKQQVRLAALGENERHQRNVLTKLALLGSLFFLA
jgi:hypothetical protein